MSRQFIYLSPFLFTLQVFVGRARVVCSHDFRLTPSPPRLLLCRECGPFSQPLLGKGVTSTIFVDSSIMSLVLKEMCP